MCGIAGLYFFDQNKLNQNSLQRMNSVAHYRGPDDEGFLLINTQNGQFKQFIGDDSDDQLKERHNHICTAEERTYNLALCFRRLAIVDLSIAGHQPMTEETQRYWLTFNGEIYNYLELRTELEHAGFKFHTTGDSEVLIKSYIHWGQHCVEHFIGMFAFVLWDNKEKTLFGARDRFGVKPFNYYLDHTKFIWASEEKQIIASGLIDLNYNDHAFSEFFLHHELHHSDMTFISNVFKLRPGHYFILRNQKIEIRKFWDIDSSNRSHLSERDQVKQFKETFTDSVRLRLRSDVPVGIALSGGLDSSSIALTSKSILNKTIKTFSVYYDVDKKYDEREFIKAVLDTGGFEPHFYTQDEQINLEQIRHWTFHQDAPTSGASPYSAYLNYKNVRNAGIIVLLNGQGGDEILGGYPYYFKYLVKDQLKKIQISSLTKNLFGWTTHESLKNAMKYFGGGLAALCLPAHYLHRLEKNKYITPELYRLNEFTSEKYFIESFNNNLSKSLYDSLRTGMIPHLLNWEDRNSMACSIESRVPFLDHRLAELMFSLPNHQKISKGVTKIILRKALSDLLPEKILHRKDKKGFGTPTDIWTSGIMKTQINDLIADPTFETRPYWKAKDIKKAYQNNLLAENELWKIITAEMFMQEFEKLKRSIR